MIAAVGIDAGRDSSRSQPRLDSLPGIDAVVGLVRARRTWSLAAACDEHLDPGARHQDDLGSSPPRRIGRERGPVACPQLEREAPGLFLEGLQAEAIGDVGADVGELPDLDLPSFDHDARMDLPGHRENPPLVGMLLLPALAREGSSIDVRQLAVPAHGELAAAALSGIGLIAKGIVRGPIARIRAPKELDEPEPL